MDTEEIQKALDTASQSETVTILLSDTAGDKDFLAAQTLKEKLGQKASVVNISDGLKRRWSFLFGQIDDIKKEVILSLDVEKNPIEELRYEREGGRLKIYLTPQFPLRAEDFIFEETYHPSDMVIALGFTSKENLREKLREVPLKNPEAIITIGRGFEERSTQPLSSDSLKLWARAMLRSSQENDPPLFWAFIPKDDFQKTNQSIESLPHIILTMANTISPQCPIVVLWQDPKGNDASVRATIYSENRQKLSAIAAAANTTLSASASIMIGPYPTFSEAETETRKLLKRVL